MMARTFSLSVLQCGHQRTLITLSPSSSAMVQITSLSLQASLHIKQATGLFIISTVLVINNNDMNNSNSSSKTKERKSMTAMDDKADLGQLYLSDLDGAESVFSVESRYSQYSADRRKVLKKGDPALSQEEKPGNLASSSDHGFFSYHNDQQHSLRSGGRRPTRSKSMDHGMPDYGARDDSEASSSNSDDSSFTNDLNSYSKKVAAETNYIPRRGGRRSKSLDFTNTDIEIVCDPEPEPEPEPTKKLKNKKVESVASKTPAPPRRSSPGRSKSADFSQSPAMAARGKSQPINKSPIRSKSVEDLRKTFTVGDEKNSTGSSSSSPGNNKTLDSIRSKSIKLLRQELDLLGVSTKDAVEKEDLVQLLYKNSDNNKSSSSSSNSRNKSSSPDTVVISLEDLRSKSIKVLRQELDSLKVSTKDAVEKEELVQRLYNAKSKRRMSSII